MTTVELYIERHRNEPEMLREERARLAILRDQARLELTTLVRQIVLLDAALCIDDTPDGALSEAGREQHARGLRGLAQREGGR